MFKKGANMLRKLYLSWQIRRLTLNLHKYDCSEGENLLGNYYYELNSLEWIQVRDHDEGKAV